MSSRLWKLALTTALCSPLCLTQAKGFLHRFPLSFLAGEGERFSAESLFISEQMWC